MRLPSVTVFIYFAVTALSSGAQVSPAERSEISDALHRANTLESQGRIKESERILSQLIRRLESSNRQSLEMAVSLNNLGVQYGSVGRYEDAERLLKRSIGILKELEGAPAQEGLARTTLHLAAIYLECRRVHDAKKLDIRSLLETLPAPEDRARGKSMLAALAFVQNDFESAERLNLEALSFWTDPARATTDRLEIATVYNNLGAIALRQGRTEAARLWLTRCLSVWREMGGPTSPFAIRSMTNVAMLFMQQKRFDEAASWLAHALEIGRDIYGELHPFTVAMQTAYAEALKKSGRKSEAKLAAAAAAAARSSMRELSTTSYTVDYRDLLSDHNRRR